MKTFASVAVALVLAGASIVNADTHVDTNLIVGATLGPDVTIDSGSGNNVGNTVESTSIDSSVTMTAGGPAVTSGNNAGGVDSTSTSNGGAMGMMPLPTMMPAMGGMLAAAAVFL